MIKNLILTFPEGNLFGWPHSWGIKNHCAWIESSQEIKPDNLDCYQLRPEKKIVLVKAFQLHQKYTAEEILNPPTIDLSWANLIIGYTPEIVDCLQDFGTDILNFLRTRYQNHNVIILAGGKHHAQAADARLFDRLTVPMDHVVLSNPNYKLKDIPTEKKFLMDVLMGQNKSERRWLVENILNSDLESKSLISICAGKHHSAYRSVALQTLDLVEISTNWHQLADQQINPANLSIKSTFCDFNQCVNIIVPTNVYDHAWYSIISETNFGSDFLTEKTAKCLLAGRIFVSFSSFGILKKLRSHGFETFGQCVDESYDNIVNSNQRMLAAWQALNELLAQDPVKVYKKLWPVIEHNHNVIKNVKNRFLQTQSFIKQWI